MAKDLQVGEAVKGKVITTIGVAHAKLKQPGPGHKTITMKGRVIARPVPPSRMYRILWEDSKQSLCASSVLQRLDDGPSEQAPAPAAAAVSAASAARPGGLGFVPRLQKAPAGGADTSGTLVGFSAKNPRGLAFVPRSEGASSVAGGSSAAAAASGALQLVRRWSARCAGTRMRGSIARPARQNRCRQPETSSV